MSYGHGLTRTADVADYWSAQSKFADTVETVQPESNLGCSRVSMVWTRQVPAGVREDVCVMSMALAKIVGGGLYSVLDSAGYTAAETALDTLWADIKTHVSNGLTLSEFRWHEHRASHPATEKGFETIGPAVRITAKSSAGGAISSRNTDQVSSTVTWRTTSRKHWGRVYIPGLAYSALETQYGRLANTTVDNLALRFRTFEASLNTAGIQLGVWTWKFKAFLQLSELRVDNVADIQRRRRPKMSNYAKAYNT